MKAKVNTNSSISRIISFILFMTILFTSFFSLSGVAEAVTKEIEAIGAIMQSESVGASFTAKYYCGDNGEYINGRTSPASQTITIGTAGNRSTYTSLKNFANCDIAYSGSGTKYFKGWSAQKKNSNDKWVTKYENKTTGDTQWKVAGNQDSGYTKYIYENKQMVYNTVDDGATVRFYAEWGTNPTFTVEYRPNEPEGGTYTNMNTYKQIQYVNYTTSTDSSTWTALKAFSSCNISAPSAKPYFVGWAAKRESTGKYRYINKSGDTGWYEAGSQPSGYHLYIYDDQQKIRSTVPPGDCVLMVAQWSNAKYTIHYRANGGSGSMSDSTHYYGSPSFISTNTFTKSGCTFAGWYAWRWKSGSNNTIKEWRYIDDDNNHAWYVPGEQEAGQKARDPSTYTYSSSGSPMGFHLQLITEPYITTGLVNNDGGEVYLEAQWKHNSTGVVTYYIEYNANGGVGEMEESKIVMSNKEPYKHTRTRVPTFTKKGYKLVGWRAFRRSDGKWRFKNPSGGDISGSSFKEFKNFMADEGSWKSNGYRLYDYQLNGNVHMTSQVDCDVVTFYAIWEPTTTYTLHFIGNGASNSISDQELSIYSNYTVPQNPFVRDGYIFNGFTVYNRDKGMYLYKKSDTEWKYTKGETGYSWIYIYPNNVLPPLGDAGDDVEIMPWWTKTYTVVYNSSEPAKGSVSASNNIKSNDLVAENTNITFTANAKTNYKFSSWTVEGISITDEQRTSPTLSLTITADVVVTANFELDLGQLEQGMMLIYNTSNTDAASNPATLTKYKNFNRLSNGKYAVKLSLDDDEFSLGSWLDFAYSTTNHYETMQQQVNRVTTTAPDGYMLVGMQTYGSYTFPRFKALNDNIIGVSIILDTTENTFTVVPEINYDAEEYCTIYAKFGTVRNGYTKYAEMANTTITSGLLTEAEDYKYYEIGHAEREKTITITTTIKESYRDTYYVKAFCVNGETYNVISAEEAMANNVETGEYTFTYEITEASPSKIEITPIYFYLDSSGTVTVYADEFEGTVKTQWGNTIAAYATYKNGVDQSSSHTELKNALGGYPGQPMVEEGGRYYMQVPRYLNFDLNYPLTGVSFNNYTYDEVHKLINPSLVNRATYDAGDAAAIANRSDSGNIVFQFKYRTACDNNPGETFGSESNYTNGFEEYRSFSGKLVDMYGVQADTSYGYLYIVSDGNQYNPLLNSSNAVMWSIYAPNGTKIATVPSSFCSNEFADDVDPRYADVYDALFAYERYPIKITYEKALTSSDNTVRYDGRWFFTELGEKINSRLKIAYADNISNAYAGNYSFDDDNSVINGNVYFSNQEFYGATTSGNVDIDPNKYFNFIAQDNSSTYMFAGWYMCKGSNIVKRITLSSMGFSPMISGDTYVALFVKTPAGSVTIKHDLCKNANQSYSGMGHVYQGKANCTVCVQIVDNSDNVIETYGNLQNTSQVTIPEKYIKADSPYKLKIILKTNMTGLNSFAGQYMRNNTLNTYQIIPYNSIDLDEGSVQSIRYYTIRDLYYNDGTDVDTKAISTVYYYSNVIPFEKEYTINYNYFDRFDDFQIYEVNGTLSEDDIEKYISTDENGAITVKKQLYIDNLPYQLNYNKDINFNFDEVYDNSSNFYDCTFTADVNSEYTDEVKRINISYNSQYLSENDGEYDITDTISFGSYLCTGAKDLKGNPVMKLEAPENNPANLSQQFSHWEIKDMDENIISTCKSRIFNMLLYSDCYLTPVYTGVARTEGMPSTDAMLQFLGFSRNQWTSYDGVVDKIYADFLASYTKGEELIDTTQNPCGLILAAGDYVPLNDDGTIVGDISDYEFECDEAQMNKLKDYILNGIQYTADDDIKKVAKFTVNSLNNKNRIEIYQRFNNSENNIRPVIMVRSYIIVDGEVIFSDPVFINMYEVATK